jgi:membrane protein DedA with SNARE-associated domain
MTLELGIELFRQYPYAILIPLAIAEGTTVAFFVGVFIAMGILDPYLSMLILIIGDLIPDTLWYQLGRHAHRQNLVHRFGHHVGMTPARFQFVLDLWHRRPISTLILSKMAYGMGAPMLMTAGYARMRLRLYYTVSVLESFIKYGILMALGMALFESYTAALPYIKDAELLFTGTVIIVLIAAWFASRRVSQELMQEADSTS